MVYKHRLSEEKTLGAPWPPAADAHCSVTKGGFGGHLIQA